MVPRKLTAVWAFLAFTLLAAGGIAIAFSIIFKMPNLLLNFVIDPNYLLGGLVLGAMFCATFAFAIGGILQANHITIGLTLLNWVLLLDGIGVVVVGTTIWFFTLRERANFDRKFLAASPTVVQGIQDHFKCCGYFFPNETTLVTGGFCTDAAFASSQTACVGPLTGFADFTLNNIFTSVYGFMAVIIALFLATLCVINKRIESERFRKIDAKRGGRGFV